MQCCASGMESFSEDGLLGIGSTDRLAVSDTWQLERATSPSSTISLSSLSADSNIHHDIAHAALIAVGYSSTNNVSEACPPSEGFQKSQTAVAKDARITDIYAWASDLSIMERFLRDDQRHERLAVSLGLCQSAASAFSHGSLDTEAHTNNSMATKAKDHARTDLHWEGSSYGESSYDPYDQPPPAIGLPSPSALPAPNVSFEKYQELMREYFASEEPDPPSTEKIAKPPPLEKEKKEVLQAEAAPTSPPRRDSMSIQALLNDPSPQDHLDPGSPPEPRHVPPSKIMSISPLQLEPDPCLEEEDDGSIRAFAEEAHKRLVPPVSSVAPDEPAQAIPVRSDEGSATPVEQMLSQHRSRIEESRGQPRSRTVRRALLRKRKKEEDHPPGRAHPNIQQREE